MNLKKIKDSLEQSDFEEHITYILRTGYPDADFETIQDYIELMGNLSTDDEILEGFAEYISK